MSFENFGLSTDLLRALNTQGYTKPTPIQEKAIPLILKGGDIIAGAQTGTGKTAAFSLPLLHRLMETSAPSSGRRPIRALILAPTRELAIQIGENIASYSQHLPIKTAVVFGGVSINPQIDKLRKGVDVLVATPGRLLDHASQNTLSLKQVEFLVLDEADRMLDMGFIHDIKKVLALLPERTQRQNLLFSATTSKEIKQLANRLMNQPDTVEVASSNATADKVSQVMYRVEKSAKRDLLRHLITSKNWFQVLVFTRTKHGANRLAQQLEKNGIHSAAIHGNKSQGARTRALSEFKSGKVRVLVATDIAARGLDIDQLPNVVNFELPNVPEDYIHRIGRTARAGNSGEAVSLVDADEVSYLKGIEKLLNRRIPELDAGEFERTASNQSQSRSASRNDGSNTRPKKRSANQQKRSGQSGGQGSGSSSSTHNGNRNDTPGNKAGQRRRSRPKSGNRSSNPRVVA